VLRTAKHAKALTGKKNLCMAGGVALNCVANGKLIEEGVFEKVWIQPAAGDSGGAIGAAFSVLHNELESSRPSAPTPKDKMRGSLLGPGFSNDQIVSYLDDQEIAYVQLSPSERAETIAQLIADQKIVGLFDGRMEFGPRALGNRSILADARSETMQSALNQKIKFRESFRPFAASVLDESVSEYFHLEAESPYMLVVARVNDSIQVPEAEQATEPGGKAPQGDIDLMALVGRKRSTIPAVTHVDYSCRIQSVTADSNPQYFDVLKAFEKITGVGLIINTSFNVRGEPIVCTPSDAYSCFMRTHLDYLVLGDFLIDKSQQRGASNLQVWGAAGVLD